MLEMNAALGMPIHIKSVQLLKRDELNKKMFYGAKQSEG